jgi:hypothetical protein
MVQVYPGYPISFVSLILLAHGAFLTDLKSTLFCPLSRQIIRGYNGSLLGF